LRRKKGLNVEGDIETTDQRIYRNFLSTFGIDPLREPWAGMIQLAIKDGNPGRVLKNCEHTFVAAAPMPAFLHRMGLTLAGPKTLYCTLHKHAVQGPELDLVNKVFTQKYCSSCKDHQTRSDGWEFSHEWQDAENARWSKFLDEFPG
jgi:hypothetical protein